MANEASASTEINNGSRHFWLWGLIGFLTLIGIVAAVPEKDPTNTRGK